MSVPIRRTAVTALDILGLFLLALAIVILGFGGGKVHVAGVRITAETAWRPLLWFVGLVVVRLFLDRTTPPLGRPGAAWAAQFGLAERIASMRAREMPPWREVLVATLGLIAAIAIVLRTQLADWYGVPDLGDPLFSMWRMGWVAHQILADPRHLFDANTFHPERGTLTYSDSMLLPALMAAPLIWMGVPIAVAYTILLLSGFVLSGVATYLLARALTLSPVASWLSALIFALCQYRFEHYSHLELQMTQWMPLALLAAVRLLVTGSRRYFVYLALAAAAQWYSSMYYGFFLSVYAGVFILVLAAIWRPGWGRFAAATTALICGLVLALPLARAYYSTEGVRGIRGDTAVAYYSARRGHYLQPNSRSVYRDWQPMRHVGERQLFPHFTPLVLAVAGAWPPLTAARLALIGAGWVAFDGSLGFNGHWYRSAYEHLDPLKSMRVPARFAILVNLTLAMLAGAGAQRMARRAASLRMQRAVVILLGTVFLLESVPALPLTSVWRRPPSLYSTLGPESGAVLFEFPIPQESGVNIAYMYFSTWHWTRTVNGYSGYIPASYVELDSRIDGFPLGGSVAYLQSRGVTNVALHCAMWTDAECALAIERMQNDPRFRLVTATLWEGKRAQLYELSR
jgi:hypothetical protein